MPDDLAERDLVLSAAAKAVSAFWAALDSKKAAKVHTEEGVQERRGRKAKADPVRGREPEA
jgi:hypothetical protein